MKKAPSKFNFQRMLNPGSAMTFVLLSGGVIVLYFFPLLSAIPEKQLDVLGFKLKDNSEAISVSLGALNNMQDLLITLMLGLAGITGVALKDGLGKLPFDKWMNSILLSLFVLAFLFFMRCAYTGYGAIIEQVDKNSIYISRLEEYVVYQVWALLSATIISSVMLYKNMLSKP